MLIIKATGTRETITIWGEVPEHPDVKDVKPHDWSAKAIRPSKIQANFDRVDGGEWEMGTITISGFDVLKTGKPSDNHSCFRDVILYTYTRERRADLAWAYDWATIELARINEVTERADLTSDVHLGEPTDLDDLDNAVCMYRGEEYPEHDWKPGDVECRRCGADLSAWNDQDSEVLS